MQQLADLEECKYVMSNFLQIFFRLADASVVLYGVIFLGDNG